MKQGGMEAINFSVFKKFKGVKTSLNCTSASLSVWGEICMCIQTGVITINFYT